MYCILVCSGVRFDTDVELKYFRHGGQVFIMVKELL